MAPRVDDEVRTMVQNGVRQAIDSIESMDPDEVLHARCEFCMRRIRRPRRVIERMNRVDGFVSCKNSCRRNRKIELERVSAERTIHIPVASDQL